MRPAFYKRFARNCIKRVTFLRNHDVVDESWKLLGDADLLERDKNISKRTPTFLLSSSEFRGTASYIRRGAARLRLINLFLSRITKVDSFPLTRSGISSVNCNRIRRGIHSCEFLSKREWERKRKSEKVAFYENSIWRKIYPEEKSEVDS